MAADTRNDLTELELTLLDALERMDRMHDMMMRQANHRASAYDADTLREMNEAPLQAKRAMEAARSREG